MQVAAELGCDITWDEARKVWCVNKIAVEADTVEIDQATLFGLSRDEFVAHYQPEPLDARL